MTIMMINMCAWNSGDDGDDDDDDDGDDDEGDDSMMKSWQWKQLQ